MMLWMGCWDSVVRDPGHGDRECGILDWMCLFGMKARTAFRLRVSLPWGPVERPGGFSEAAAAIRAG